MKTLEKRIIFLDPRKIKLNNLKTNENDRYRLLLLSESIRENGLILPVTVGKNSKGYFVVSGEKRIRAAILAGVKKIPCITGELKDGELYRIIDNFSGCYKDPFLCADTLYPLYKKHGAEKLSCLLSLSTKELIGILSLKQLSAKTRQSLKENDITHKLYQRLLSLDEEKQLELIEDLLKTLNQKELKEQDFLSVEKEQRQIKVGDKRFYINSIRRIADTMKNSGIETALVQSETSKAIEIKIRIKKTNKESSIA